MAEMMTSSHTRTHFCSRRMLSSSICAPGSGDMKVLTFQIILSDRVWLGECLQLNLILLPQTFYWTVASTGLTLKL